MSSAFRIVLFTALLVSTSAIAAQPVIGPGVVEALAQDGAVRVFVALADGVPDGRRGTVSVESLRASVAHVQDRVLTALPHDEVAVALRFEAVPAVVLEVRTEVALAALAAQPGVVRIDLDEGGGGGGGLGQSVPLVQASTWHSRGVTGEGVVVAVLDTGIDTDHPDFAGAVIDESCFLDFDGSINGSGSCPDGSDRQTGSGSGEDDHGHGTNVTGIVASRGAVSSIGVAPGAEVVVVKVLDSRNAFNAFSEIVSALDYLISNPSLGVEVVNMSLGTTALFPGVCDNSRSWTVAGAAAARTLRQRGVAMYASSMNDASATSVAAPACLTDVTAVGATTLNDEMYSLSNSGPQVEIVAPGVGIRASGNGGGTSTFSGTSQASPHVAGCAALLFAADVASTPDEIATALATASTVTVTDTDNGRSFPRLDCFDASFDVAAEDDPDGPEAILTLPQPNPARSSMRLMLRAPASETVRVTLADPLGRLVDVLHDGPALEGTPVALRADIADLAPGVYTVSAWGASFQASRRVLVVH